MLKKTKSLKKKTYMCFRTAVGSAGSDRVGISRSSASSASCHDGHTSRRKAPCTDAGIWTGIAVTGTGPQKRAMPSAVSGLAAIRSTPADPDGTCTTSTRLCRRARPAAPWASASPSSAASVSTPNAGWQSAMPRRKKKTVVANRWP